MLETMREADGVGLTAPQSRGHEKDCVCRPELENFDQEYVMSNPEIIETEGEQESAEGCLSVPGIYRMQRPNRGLGLKAMNLEGEIKIMNFLDLQRNLYNARE